MTKAHDLIKDGTSLREIDRIARTPRFWGSLKIDYAPIKDLVSESIVPSWISTEDTRARNNAPVQKSTRPWLPGAYTEVATLIDRNTSLLDPILQRATQALGSGIGEVLSRAYATGPREVATALFDAIRFTTRLQYDYEPANPGLPHQEVRLARDVLSDGLATCLDLALLYAAILERAHLAPAVLIIERDGSWHAIGGFFNNGSHGSAPHVLTDANQIQTLIADGSLIPIETTGLSVSMGRKRDFAQARDEAAKLVKAALPIAVVNVLSARESGVSPPL